MLGSYSEVMDTYILTLLKKEEVARNTLSCKVSKPENFLFKPGQYMQVFLSEDSSDSHTFSIAAAPHEDFLMFTTRIRKDSDFKQRLAARAEGSELRIEAPGGQFVLPTETELPVVFLVGGIGITPVRSMVKHEEYRSTSRPITVFYSNPTPEDAAFLHELETIALPYYRLVPTMTGMEKSAQEWNGEQGYIDEQMLRAHLKDMSQPIFYVVGPPGFVNAMVDLLHSIDEVPSTHVKSEDFAGF